MTCRTELGLQPGHPLLLMQQVTYDGAARVIEWVASYVTVG